MILSQVTLVCLAVLVFGARKYNSDSRLKICGDECPDNCLCPCSQATGECTEGCLAGYYGYNCTKRCDPHCRGNICQQHGGYCACVLGYLYRNSRCEADTGKECKSLQGCRHNRCASAGDEECIEGCKPGRFGYSCDSHCVAHCFCDQESGTCTDCVQGWFGPECQSMCSRGCTEGCYRNGSCFNGCRPGTFGETCESKCSSDCVSGCDQLSGECVECKERRYGPNCQSECSDRCAGCDREGQCIKGCVKGYYGDKCEFICPQHCNGGLCNMNGSCIESTCPSQCYDGLCDLNGTCIGESSCPIECDGGLCDLNGKCTACKTGFYGPRCSKICEGCVEGGCHKDTGECINRADKTKETNDFNFLWVVGGVTLLITGAVLILISGRIYYSARSKRRRSALGDDIESVADPRVVPFHSNPDEERANASPLICPIRRLPSANYVELGVGNQVLPMQQATHDSEQQAAAASPEALQQSEGLLDKAAALPASGGNPERPVSYLYPNYCELNEDLITSLPQLPRRPQTAGLSSSSIMSGRTSTDSDNGNVTGGNINIPLIAETFWKPDTEDLSTDKDSPDDQNYDHPFRDSYY